MDINSNALPSVTPTLFSSIQQSIQLLLQCKDDLSITASEQNTMFHTAVIYGFTQTLEDMLKNPDFKKLIHTKDQDGVTPLHIAAFGSSKPDVITIDISN